MQTAFYPGPLPHQPPAVPREIAVDPETQAITLKVINQPQRDHRF